MKYKSLGISGLDISQLCLGTNNFGGSVDEEAAKRIMRKSIDLGINVIDTADSYQQGRSEEIIGREIRGDRNRIILATKVGNPVGHGSGLARKHILWQISESLKRLQTDRIDIYYMHIFDTETPLEVTLRTFDQLVREGRILHVACSNFSVAQIKAASEICEKFDLAKIVAVQPLYNLVQREIEKDLLPFCRNSGLGVLTYSPLMGGFLTGKYVRGSPPPRDSRGSLDRAYWERRNVPGNFDAISPLLKIEREAGLPLSHLALLWILRNPDVTAPVFGASMPEQVEDNCSLVDFEPGEEARARLEALRIAES